MKKLIAVLLLSSCVTVQPAKCPEVKCPTISASAREVQFPDGDADVKLLACINEGGTLVCFDIRKVVQAAEGSAPSGPEQKL
jgi:hypothetical protein